MLARLDLSVPVLVGAQKSVVQPVEVWKEIAKEVGVVVLVLGNEPAPGRRELAVEVDRIALLPTDMAAVALLNCMTSGSVMPVSVCSSGASGRIG